MQTADAAWLKTVKEVLAEGLPVEPQKSTGAGGNASFEVRNHQMTFLLGYPIVTIKPNTSWLYMAAEAMWIIDGSNKLDYSPEIGRIQGPYSDNKVTLFGAYGPSFEAQKQYILNTLNKDKNSRQAVLAIWRRNPKMSRDVPCTIAMQFLVRDGYIHTNVYMRSSDVGKGLPYDMFSFACMTAEIASNLEIEAELGECTITAGSRHIYLQDFDRLTRMKEDTVLPEDPPYQEWKRWKWPAIREKLSLAVTVDHIMPNRIDAQQKVKELIMEAAGATDA